MNFNDENIIEEDYATEYEMEIITAHLQSKDNDTISLEDLVTDLGVDV